MTHFSAKQGRAVICGDSAQYVASAEALVHGDKLPHFELRKPGYGLFLAGVALLFGNMGWAAIACNHALLAMLPLAAYGFGRHLRSRAVGWGAAVLMIAQLQTVILGNRMMSECLFVFLLSFGLLLFVVGLSKPRTVHLMAAAGFMLGLSCITRGTGLPVVCVATLFLITKMWRDWRKVIASTACFLSPVVCLITFECSLNLILAGSFRPADGTMGGGFAFRLRHFDGMQIPPTEAANRAVALLPERSRRDVFLCNNIDMWVARYRMIHDQGMSEWEYDDLMAQFGRDMVAAAPLDYIKHSAKNMLWHLLRRPDGETLSPIPESRRAGTMIHPAAYDIDEGTEYWYAYWGLPYLPVDESIRIVARMKSAASERAPFGRSGAWSAMRYYQTRPVAATTLGGLRWLASLWPGFAIIGCPILGLRRTTCWLIAGVCIADAVLIGAFTPTNSRLQFIWLVTDTSLAAALIVALPGVMVAHWKVWLASRRATKDGRCAIAE